MEIEGINRMELNFLGKLVEDALGTHAEVIDGAMKGTDGDDWYAKYKADVAGYRESMTKFVKESAEFSAALGDRKRVHLTVGGSRRHLEGIARREKKEELRKDLLSAAGWGVGSPRTLKEYEKVVVTISQRVAAFKSHFLRLGANPKVIGFCENMWGAVDSAQVAAMREGKDVTQARKDLQHRAAGLIDSISLIDTTARAIREGHLAAEEPDELARADDLLALFDSAVATARKESRKREEEEGLPEDVLLPALPPATIEGAPAAAADVPDEPVDA